MEENVTVYDMVANIVDVVYHKYYNYVKDPELKQDLYQQGFYKAYELLNNGNYDPTMSLRNFIFTGVRNEMHNMLYHENKNQWVDLSELDKYDNIIGYHETGEYSVKMEQIKSITDKFSIYGDYFPYVYNYLVEIGLIEDSCPIPPINEPTNEGMTEAIITLVIWKIFKEERDNGGKDI